MSEKQKGPDAHTSGPEAAANVTEPTQENADSSLSSPSNETYTSPATDFLCAVCPAEGYLTVVAIHPNAGVKGGKAISAKAVHRADSYVEQHQNCNLYWSVNPTRTPLDKKPEKADVAALLWLHVDVDSLAPEVLPALLGYRVPPTLVIASGGGFQGFWKLREPIPVSSPEEVTRLEDYNRKLIAEFGGDPGTHNLDRIMRLPGTTNWPTKTKLAKGRTPVPATVVEFHPDRLYALTDFEPMTAAELEAALGKRPTQRKSSARQTDRSRDLLAKVADMVRSKATDEEIHERLCVHPHAADQSDPAKAVQRCIDRVREDLRKASTEVAEHLAGLWLGGRFLALWKHEWDEAANMPRITTIEAAQTYWRRWQTGKTNPVVEWTYSEGREDYAGLEFAPDGGRPGYFNLFRGWPVEPDPRGEAGCSLVLSHLRDVICGGDESLFEYVEQWFANLVQLPSEKPGTALAMFSAPGAGKGAVIRYLSPILGRYMVELNGSDQLLGRFNDVFVGRLLIFGDEVVWAKDRRSADKLKAYITEPRIAVEPKGLPVIKVANFARIVTATNHEEAAPIELHDRRYVPLRLPGERIGDFAYWRALTAECNSGGAGCLLHYLQHLPINRELRETPKTSTLAEQTLLGLDSVGEFWRFCLMRREHALEEGTGNNRSVRYMWRFGGLIRPALLWEFYLDFARKTGDRYPASLDGFARRLRRYVQLHHREARTAERTALGSDSRMMVYELPPLDEARRQFERAVGGKVEWPHDSAPAGVTE